MFTIVKAHEFNENQGILQSVYQLRKKVFIDELQWDIPAQGDKEIDCYDNEYASYIVWHKPETNEIYGALRIISTARPTLLNDVFYATHGCNPALSFPSVFEGTRLCVDKDLIARDFPNLDPARGIQLMLLALCEVALAHGIERMVSNFEAPLSRIYRRSGLKYDLHGQADGYGRKPVFCASFPVNSAVLSKMRAAIGVELPLYRHVGGTGPLVPAIAEKASPLPA